MREFIPKLDPVSGRFYLCLGLFKFTTKDFEDTTVSYEGRVIDVFNVKQMEQIFNLRLVESIVPDETNSAKERSKRLREGYYDSQWDIPRQDI